MELEHVVVGLPCVPHGGDAKQSKPACSRETTCARNGPPGYRYTEHESSTTLPGTTPVDMVAAGRWLVSPLVTMVADFGPELGVLLSGLDC